LLLGAPLVSVGLGLGIPHAREDGWSPVSVAGGAALLAGLVVTGMLVRAVRHHRGWQLLVRVLPAAITWLLVVYVVTIPLAVARSPHVRAGRQLPRDVGLAVRPVDLVSADGTQLAAWFAPSRTGAAVVLLHGSGSDRSSVLPQAAVLHRHGFGVLLLDARGHGASDGRAMEWGWGAEQDVSAAVSYLARSPDVDPGRIAVVGLSLGGEVALGAAAADQRVRAVVAEGVTGRSAADLHWLSQAYGWRGALQEGVEAARTTLVRVLVGRESPITLRAAVRRTAPRPLLLVTAGTVADEGRAAADVAAAASGSAQIWSVPGSAHTGALRTAPSEWEQRVVAFLTRSTGRDTSTG
jgi:pimeloyl-ACP methyl ester carboxylesterase